MSMPNSLSYITNNENISLFSIIERVSTVIAWQCVVRIMQNSYSNANNHSPKLNPVVTYPNGYNSFVLA